MAAPVKTPITDLNELCKKKEELMTTSERISRLNSLIEQAIISTEDGIQKDSDTKNIKKRAESIALENELLELENSRLQKHYELTTQRNSLELQFLEQQCEHQAKMEKIKEKYPFVDVSSFSPDMGLNRAVVLSSTAAVPQAAPAALTAVPQAAPAAQVPQAPPPPVAPPVPVVETPPVVVRAAPRPVVATGDPLQQHLQSALRERFKNVNN